ncbi:MAG: phosphosulfolactate synthase [Flammeovirgaceae bacterium]|nr:phosphosulfolactate synthase [Flammeovirgaceae bacterium]|tara:strand:+ start:4289 stop:5044 length:756 start_codon:yes stop_codon:yes gene_type:complete
MNFNLKNIPERSLKPRELGITMVIDKGSSLQECKNLIESSSDYIDFVKFGWTTSNFSKNLKEKIELFKKANINVYLGGTLFEAFAIRDQFEDYIDILKEYDLKYAEVSDGSISIPHKKKCEYIEKLAKHFIVFSEIGSKDEKKIIPPYKWIKQMKAELSAGSWKVIGEARESGSVGLFRSSGEVRQGLVEEILTEIPTEKILWEAPQKVQQVWFVKLLGQNVNLGNISGNEVISLETIRVGLRGDTFNQYI